MCEWPKSTFVVARIWCVSNFEYLGMLCTFQKELDNLWLFCSLDSHLCTYVYLYLAKVVSMV